MKLTIEEIKKIIQKRPPHIQFTQDIVKEQAYICLNCLNSWGEKGFLIKKEEDFWRIICNNCEEIIWKEKQDEKKPSPEKLY